MTLCRFYTALILFHCFDGLQHPVHSIFGLYHREPYPQKVLYLKLYDIHGSLKHTVQRERTAFKALEAAKESADNIVDGISNAIVKAEKHTVIHAKVDESELAKVNQCSAQHIKAEKKLLEEHSKELAKHLQKNEGIWLSSGWLRFIIVVLAICCIAVILWVYIKS